MPVSHDEHGPTVSSSHGSTGFRLIRLLFVLFQQIWGPSLGLPRVNVVSFDWMNMVS